ncbi:MAG: prephenate dehydrogenase/arogenate dehydrogenase family protein [Candidatus Moranbacteria bacterium]|nr:prephenate dehydrogenase/arogenate dehydrogenase family protein [Candidatus Moranbacteria bacterium]
MKAINPRIGIIGGTSAFGQWFRHLFEKNGLECVVAGRKTELTPIELARQCDIVIVSVPIRSTAAMIREIRDVMKPTALLCDFTSVKEMPMREMMKRKRGGVLGIHPLFGPLTPSMATQNIVFCIGRHDKWVDFLKEFFLKNKGLVRFMTPREHDETMAVVQALTHFSNIAFVRMLKRRGVRPDTVFSTPVFRWQSLVAGRILGSNLPVYSDIEIYSDRFRSVLKEYLKETGKMADLVLREKGDDLERLFLETSRYVSDFIPIAEVKTTEIAHILEHRSLGMDVSNRRPGGSRSKTRIACLGPIGTYSYFAALEISDKTRIIVQDSIRQVFDAVANSEVGLGIVPVENSINGIVQESLDALLEYPMKVIGSLTLPIDHYLLASTDDAKKITVIRSHAQPLGQCRRWLVRHFPNAKLEPYPSTVQAVESSREPNVAFVAHRDMARLYGLKILHEHIQDNPDNATEFYVIANSRHEKAAGKLQRDKTALIVTVYDRPGVLRDILDVIYRSNVNITKLHSRKSVASGWDYSFYLVLDCGSHAPVLKNILREMKTHCSIVRVLGEA